MYANLTVFFDEPFRVGVFERTEDEKLSACKVTFGAEPKDNEMRDFILLNYGRLENSPSLEAAAKERADSPGAASAAPEGSRSGPAWTRNPSRRCRYSGKR